MTKIIWPALSVLVAAGIFVSSALSGEVSGYASMTIAGLVRFFVPVSDSTLAVLHFLLRKAAHFVVYFALAFCVAHSLKFYIHRANALFLWAWGIASIYGITDEIHQYFVPGRVPALLDVVINSVGAAAGAVVVLWWLCRYRSGRTFEQRVL